MALTDRLDVPVRRPKTGFPCSVGVLRAELPTEEQAALDRMLWELGWTDRQIYEEVTAEGYSVGEQTVGRHRRRVCRCFKERA